VSTPAFVRIMAAVAMALALFASRQPLLAQPIPEMKRIGVALSGYGPESRPVQAFRRGLEEAGYAIVTNLSRPGVNITGLSNMTLDLASKRLQLLKDAVPESKRVGVIWNPDTPWHQRAVEQLQGAAVGLGITLEPVAAQTSADIAPAFATLARAKVDALLLVDGPFVALHAPAIMREVRQSRLPAVHWSRDLLEQGLLIAYGPDPVDIFRRASGYVDKILRGAKPGDLPIAQPTKFELLVNLKVARALGIEVPQSLLLSADEVIR
jgi:putative ABC transport system substrate-binding protein